MRHTEVSTLVLILAALLAGPALADESPVPLTRAQVKADYLQARRDGTLPIVDAEGRVIVPKRGTAADANTRREVKDEYFEARREGTLPVFDGEGRPLQAQAVMGGPPLTREQVKQELREARRSGDMAASGDEHGRTEREFFPQQYEYRERREMK